MGNGAARGGGRADLRTSLKELQRAYIVPHWMDALSHPKM